MEKIFERLLTRLGVGVGSVANSKAFAARKLQEMLGEGAEVEVVETAEGANAVVNGFGGAVEISYGFSEHPCGEYVVRSVSVKSVAA